MQNCGLFSNFKVFKIKELTKQSAMFCIDKITEIFCICDDFCREFDAETSKKAVETTKYRGCGKRKPGISDSEVMSILTIFHTNTFRNFKHFYIHFVLEHLKPLFPQAPSYSRFITLMKRVGVKLAFFLKLCLMGKCTGISFVDSTCIPVCNNRRISRNKVFKGLATRGKSTMGWYFGFKLHLLCNEKGELLDFVLTKANVDDRNELVFKVFEKNLFGKLYADKGYISQSLFEMLWNNDVHIVTGLRANMKNKLMSVWDKIMLRKRFIIETINDQLKNVCQIVHSRHRSMDNFLINILVALSAYCFFDKKPSINVDFNIDAADGQLTLWS